jgi:flagellin-like protein
MSAKTKRIERSQRFRRAWRGENRARAVSPVVATLILILIAVAAAAALYLWLVGWQSGVTGTISNPTVPADLTVTIGGSTSVYPFSSLGATWFEQNTTTVKIADSQGGTGAGMLAVCSGAVQVGAASTPETVSGLVSADACPASDPITITTIAYDAVDVVVPAANTHGLLSINYDTLALIYDGASISLPTLVPTTLNGAAFPAGYPTETTAAVTPLLWSQIPAAVNGATVGAVTQQIETAGAGAGGAACAGFANDICAATPGTTATPCGWAVCSSGAVAVVPVERSDASGTTQTFEAKLLGATAGNKFAANFAGLGYSGCGSNNLLSDCGISVATQENGNPSVIAEVGGTSGANTIGYASDGLARAAGLGLVPFNAVGQATPVVSGPSYAFGAVVPTTGSSGTIAAGITGNAAANQYAGWRPFEFVTLAPPTAGSVEENFFNFLLGPQVNTNLALATGEVSVYSI